MMGILFGNLPKLSVDFPFFHASLPHLRLHFSEFSSDPVELGGMVEGVRLCDAWDIPVGRTSLPLWAQLYMAAVFMVWPLAIFGYEGL